jgi:hypothetical protein
MRWDPLSVGEHSSLGFSSWLESIWSESGAQILYKLSLCHLRISPLVLSPPN